MRPAFLLLLACALAACARDAGRSAVAADCTLADAIYDQASTDWVLRFAPMEEHHSASQENVFSLAIPGTKLVMQGSAGPTLGFGQKWGGVHIACPQGGDEPGCNMWDGPIYAATPDGVTDLPQETAPPPAQLIFPLFGSDLWYSIHPQVEFRDIVPGDVFDFAGCAA